MSYASEALIDRAALARLRNEVQAELPRLAGYFREDAVKSIAAVEEAVRSRDAAAMVRPAHTLKGESWQFGCMRLGRLAEQIEKAARRAVEERDFPDVLQDVVQLRPTFADTADALGREIIALTPVTRIAGGFGRKVTPVGFGRA